MNDLTKIKISAKRLFFILLLLLKQVQSSAQVYLDFEKVNCKSSDIPLHRISVIDKRADTTAALGKVKVDYRKGFEALLPKQSLSRDLEMYYREINDTNLSRNRELIILVYDFDAQESATPTIDDETAIFRYSADYFVSDSVDSYQFLGSVNANIPLQAYDVTKPLLKSIPYILCTQYEKLYHDLPSTEHQFSYQEVLKYNDKERKYFPLSYSDSFGNEEFNTWNDFLALRNANNKAVQEKPNTIISYRIKNYKKSIKHNRQAKILVHNGVFYFNYNHQYFRMDRKDGDFYVTVNFKVHKINSDDAYFAWLMLGVSGAIVSNSKSYITEIWNCKVDFRTGDLIPTKKVSKKQLKFEQSHPN